MSPDLIAITGIIVMLLFMLVLRMPVGFAMALAGFLGLCYMISPQAAFNIVGAEIWGQLSSYTFTVIPLFIWMGYIAFNSGLSERLYEAAYKWFGQLPGGLAIATIGACAGFGAICGSNTATTATMGTVALPQMKKYNYDMEFSAGTVAAAGTLGVVIPPSIALIVYGTFTTTSIGELFLAAIFPGIILAGLMMVVVYMRCRFNPYLGPMGPKTSFMEKVIAANGVIETLVLFVLVIGGLYIGWFTPTEAGAAGSCGALIIALARRRLTWQGFVRSVTSAVRISCFVMLLVWGAIIFGRFLTATRLPFVLAEWTGTLPVPPVVVLASVLLVYIIGGCFMDALGLFLVTIPIFFPVITAVGYDPVFFGIMICVVTVVGGITPPVGINVYVVSGLVPDIPIHKIFRGANYFFVTYIVCGIIITAFPQIVLFLPSLMR